MNKYLFLIPSLGSGGAERVLVTIANNLAESNEIHIITLTDGECYYKLNKNVHRHSVKFNVNRRNIFTTLFTEVVGFFIGMSFIKKMINEIKPDAILSFLVHTNAMLIILKCLGIANMKCIVSERADPFKRNFINRWFEFHFYKKVDCIVCQSQAVVKFFDKNTANKICIIKNPISMDAIPERYIGKRKKTIVGVGRLFPQKNFSLLIDAFYDVSRKYPEYSLEIYGAGYLRDELQKQIEQYGLEEKAHLMGERKNVMHYIADSTVFVLSSEFEGFPNALIEAMATGLPVISTDFSPVGVAKEIIGKENGIVVPRNDKNSLVNALETIIKNDTLQEHMSVHNREIMYVLDERAITYKWAEILKN